jgi:hypothetical protein
MSAFQPEVLTEEEVEQILTQVTARRLPGRGSGPLLL